MLETGDFVPQVDLRFPIAELAIESAGVEVTGNDATATLRRTLPANGPYTLIVSGASDEDAGDYTLDLTLEGRSAEIPATSTPEVETSPTARATATSTATAEETATSTGPRGRRGLPTPRATADATRTQPAVTPRATATPRPTSGVTPSPTATSAVTSVPTPTRTASATPTPFLPTQLEIFCTVITDRLNLRPGPGTNFTPIIDVLEIGELLVVVGRNDDSSWLQVEVLDENLIIENTGWVSAEFVFCVGDINDAPVIEGDA
jgi:hypothetical protein